MNEKEIIEMLTHYYEVDLGNCLMTHEQWIAEVAKALTDKDYLKNLQEEYKKYLEEISA